MILRTKQVPLFRDKLERQMMERPLLGKPASKEVVQRAPDWSGGVRVRIATKADIPVIASWAASADEVRFVGVKGSKLRKMDVSTWITDSVGAFVLTESDDPVAFVNAVLNEGPQTIEVEVGRLLVAPHQRRRGFGSTLVRNLCLAIISTRKNVPLKNENGGDPWFNNALQKSPIVSRVVEENTVGKHLIEALPFERFERTEDEINSWYQYRERINARLLGGLMQQLRNEKGISQSTLAFQSGVQRATINMVESGRRTASLDLLWSICKVLGSNQFDAVKLLLASIGEAPEESLSYYETVGALPANYEKSVWILSDVLGENIPSMPQFYSNAKEAISQGFDRYYFLPPGQWEIQGKLLLDRLRADLGRGLADNLKEHFRVYEAPGTLCSLRVVIEGPQAANPDRVTIGGEGDKRIPLSSSQASKFHDNLRTIVLNLDQRADSGLADWFQGFRRCFPEVKSR